MKNAIAQLYKTYCLEGCPGGSFLDYLRQKNAYIFAHHPALPVFHGHSWCVNGLYFCKSCLLIFAGFVVALVGIISFWWIPFVSEFDLLMIFGVSVLPLMWTLVARYSAPFKVVSRVLLGSVVATGCASLFGPHSLAYKGFVVATFFLARRWISRRRQTEILRLAAAAHTAAR